MNIISQGACWSRCQQVHVHCLSPKGPPVTGSRRPFKLSFRSSVHLFICSFTDPALNSAQLTDACSVQTQSWPRVPQRCDRRLSPGTHSPVGGGAGAPSPPSFWGPAAHRRERLACCPVQAPGGDDSKPAAERAGMPQAHGESAAGQDRSLPPNPAHLGSGTARGRER